MFISPAYAQAAAGDQTQSLTAFVPLILIFVIFYFLMIRPQQKKMKDHRAVLDAIRRGDRIVTNGGLVGLVIKVNADERQVDVEIAEGVRVKVMRDMISSVLSKTEPVGKDDKIKDDKTKDKAETKAD
jgi:preprotein translocase subunit YajC